VALRADEKGIWRRRLQSPRNVVNLVGNAIKFTHHGQVQLEVVPESHINGNHCPHFVVSDTGIGISLKRNP